MQDESSSDYLDSYSIQIARLVIASSYLEHRLNDLIRSALALDELQTNALVNPMSSRNKVTLLKQLDREHLEGRFFARWDLVNFCKDADKLLSERNEIIHGQFGHDENKRISVKAFTGKNKLKGSRQLWPGDKLSKLATDIMGLVEKADEYLETTRELAAEALEKHLGATK